jgi:hypothetical protein
LRNNCGLKSKKLVIKSSRPPYTLTNKPKVGEKC